MMLNTDIIEVQIMIYKFLVQLSLPYGKKQYLAGSKHVFGNWYID